MQTPGKKEMQPAVCPFSSSSQTGGEKSSVTLETMAGLNSVLISACSKYGDFSAGGWGLQDFLNSSRMGKDHFDRDQLVSDLYFAILFAQDVGYITRALALRTTLCVL